MIHIMMDINEHQDQRYTRSDNNGRNLYLLGVSVLVITYDEFKLHYPGLETDRNEFVQVLNSIKSYQNSMNIILNEKSKRGQFPKFWQIILSKDKKAVYNLMKQKPKKRYISH